MLKVKHLNKCLQEGDLKEEAFQNPSKLAYPLLLGI